MWTVRQSGSDWAKGRVKPVSVCAKFTDLDRSTWPDVIRLRHYTSNQGFAAIKESMKILAGDQNAVFAVRAKGKPLSMADAADKFKIKQNHARNYIDFDIDTNRVEFRKNDLGVEEYKIKGDIELDEKTTEFNKRC